MQYKDVTLKNFHTLPLAGIAFHRVNLSECRLLESIDAEMISILNRESGPDAVYREYENDTVIRKREKIIVYNEKKNKKKKKK